MFYTYKLRHKQESKTERNNRTRLHEQQYNVTFFFLPVNGKKDRKEEENKLTCKGAYYRWLHTK